MPNGGALFSACPAHSDLGLSKHGSASALSALPMAQRALVFEKLLASGEVDLAVRKFLFGFQSSRRNRDGEYNEEKRTVHKAHILHQVLAKYSIAARSRSDLFIVTARFS